MKALCIRDCFDSKASKGYQRTGVYEVDPESPIAKHFDFNHPDLRLIEQRQAAAEQERGRTLENIHNRINAIQFQEERESSLDFLKMFRI